MYAEWGCLLSLLAELMSLPQRGGRMGCIFNVEWFVDGLVLRRANMMSPVVLRRISLGV